MLMKTLVRVYTAIAKGMGCTTETMLVMDLKLSQQTIEKVLQSGFLTGEIEYREAMEGSSPPVALTAKGHAFLQAKRVPGSK